MQYRTFGSLTWKPSALGFGAMRLPVINGNAALIDEPEATRMIRYAIDHGVNYVDTAYRYHQQTSEVFLGRALQNGYRQRIKLASKLPLNLVHTTQDFYRLFYEELERLQTDYIDFYLFHGLREKSWQKVLELRLIEQAEDAIAKGLIHYLGFSFHDRFEVFKDIITGYDGWTFCQIQYNYMDEAYQAGTKGLKYAAAKGLGIVIMEPIRGGQLTINPPPDILKLWDTAPTKRTPAEWALQWVWNHPEVSLVLSGMSTMAQVEQNVASAENSGPGKLMPDELALIDRIRYKYRELSPIACTNCKYCLPCPSGVNIPRVFEIYNDAQMYNTLKRPRRLYSKLGDEERADKCRQCHECEELCPQEISIPDWLIKAHRTLG